MNNKPYHTWIKEQLNLTKVRVHKWSEWDEDGRYEAFIDTRRVIIPVPVCDWSFLVGLHEIGHVSTGHRLYSYLMEYNAERWAIKRAAQAYNIVHEEYIQDAKNYVTAHLIHDLAYTELRPHQVKHYVYDWLLIDPSTIKSKVEEHLSIPKIHQEVVF